MDPGTQTASSTDEFHEKLRLKSKKPTPLMAGTPEPCTWTVIPLELALAATLSTGERFHVAPLGSQDPVLPAALVNVKAVTELLKVFPYDAIEFVEAAFRSRVTDQSNRSPVTIDVPAEVVATE